METKECVIDLMLDSGAHSLYTTHMLNLKGKSKYARTYDWTESREFQDYLDNYAAFIKEYEHHLTCYVTVDVIFNPARSWEVLKYLEDKHGLSPMPVVHYGTDLKWLKKYIEAGYTYIGLGGLGQEAPKRLYYTWADEAFNIICDQPSRLPLVKVHGFAMTALSLMTRYPWYSVDSTTWIIHGAHGSILIPKYKGNKWVYDENAWVVAVSSRNPTTKVIGQHIKTLSPRQQQLCLDYIHAKGYRLGKSRFERVSQGYVPKDNELWIEKKPKEEDKPRLLEIIEEEGISNRHHLRSEMNFIYFQDLQNALPEWPWPFGRLPTRKLDLS